MKNKASLNIDSSGPLAVSEDGRSVVGELLSARCPQSAAL